MTGLLIKRGKFNFIYYDFSNFNRVKIESILEFYKDYSFYDFNTTQEYIEFLEAIKLPWLEQENVRKEVIKQKAKELNININDFSNLELLESNLDKEFYNKALQKEILECDEKTLLDELRILANILNQKSKYEHLPEPLRLEYLLALILGRKYGIDELSSNLIYNEDGEPLSYAPGGKVDLEFKDFLIEATMIRNKNQQLNSETTSIARHMKESKDKKNISLRTALIAPFIHFDVALFFKFCAKEFESKIAPLSIKNFIKLIEKSLNFSDFQRNFDHFVNELLEKKTQDYITKINKD